jgi:lathosterol oxidase
MAMHPLELATYQSIMLLPLFVMPVYVGGLIFVLVYQNYVGLLDHSGIDFHSWFPWQPPTRFHDDHHVHFHVNYGQNMGVWDRLFGTYRRNDRVYGEDVFGGRGAPKSEGALEGPPDYVDYGRKARARVSAAAADSGS